MNRLMADWDYFQEVITAENAGEVWPASHLYIPQTADIAHSY